MSLRNVTRCICAAVCLAVFAACLAVPLSAWGAESSDDETPPVEIPGADEPSQDELGPAASEASTLAMYRLYNRYSGEHFYTSSSDERDGLIILGWDDEGVGWYAPASSSTPVYRVYNPYSGDHHYTTDAIERDNLVAVGWKDENIGWYSDDAQGQPLYRQFNPYETIGTHNYTVSLAENNALVSLGWRAEGIAWYGVDLFAGARANAIAWAQTFAASVPHFENVAGFTAWRTANPDAEFVVLDREELALQLIMPVASGGGGFSKEIAEFAVENAAIDWNALARSAAIRWSVEVNPDAASVASALANWGFTQSEIDYALAGLGA